MVERLVTKPLRGVLREREPMARHTTWRVGGPAERFYEPADCDDLAAMLRLLPVDEPIFWLGMGSNLLVRDGGIRGTVIHTTNRLAGIQRLDENRVRVEAGVPCAKVAGGALLMNAGAFGGETWTLVNEVETVDRAGMPRRRLPGEYEVAYRRVKGPEGEWFTAAVLRLQPGDTQQGQQRMRELSGQRRFGVP